MKRAYVIWLLLVTVSLVSYVPISAQENKDKKREQEERLKKQPEMLINADAEKIGGIIVKSMIQAGYTLDKEDKYQLVFRKKVGGASGFLAGTLVGRDMENPHQLITFILVKQESQTLVSAKAAILYPDKNNQGIPRNVDSKKVRKELWANLDEIKAQAEQK